MTMEYNEFRYLWPPRPENPVLPMMLGFYEKKGWIAQVKKNGTCAVFGIGPNNEYVAMNRHNENHKAWKGYQPIQDFFLGIKRTGWLYFVGELLHSKTDIKNKIYIHDILVHNSNYLVGSTWKERQEILNNMFGKGMEADSHYELTSDVWLVKNYTSGFKNLYDSLSKVEDEGLVLKDPNARLEMCVKSQSNNQWQVKSRKSSKNYGF